jgi:hypothetical protein
LSLKYFEEEKRTGASGWAPIGRFSWRDRNRAIFKNIVWEANEQGSQYPPVKAKLFASGESLVALLKEYNEQIIPLAERHAW